MTTIELSDKEKELFIALNCESVMNIPDYLGTLSVTLAYLIAAEACFIDDRGSPKARGSLRRCILAMRAGEVHRLTPEFDQLIQLE